MKELLVSGCLLLGVALMLTAAIGVLRLPDLLCRSHAVAKASALGIFLILIGMWIHLGAQVSGLKIALAIFFQLVTIPVSSHLVGMLAHEKRIPRWRDRPEAGQADPPGA
jgi:multicomponent Na+:H+ antiporter subunit G